MPRWFLVQHAPPATNEAALEQGRGAHRVVTAPGARLLQPPLCGKSGLEPEQPKRIITWWTGRAPICLELSEGQVVNRTLLLSLAIVSSCCRYAESAEMPRIY